MKQGVLFTFSIVDGLIMVAKYILLATLVVGAIGLPTIEEPTATKNDVSMFFDHSIEDFSSRIVGGNVAGEGGWPWMVGLSSGILARSFLCGGSLITNRHILTAAHCIDHVFSFGSLASSLRAHVGTNRWASGGQTVSLARNITHPNYVSATIKNDIGFLISSWDITFNDRVRPIVLSFDWVGAGVPSRVAGWGRIRQGGAVSNVLLELRVNTFDANRCVTEVPRVAASFNIRAPPVEPHIEICTFHSINHGTCHGDSGSSLVRESNQQQIGIVSWGLPCARGAPDMFVRISAYRAWVEASLR